MMPASTQRAYLPQLDALRGLAVAAVLFHHLYPDLYRTAPWMPSGWEGVRLFFVISGYLITGILLDCKAYYRDGAASRGSLLRRFYARRFLRIFPAYYLTLAVAALLNLGSVRQEWPWHVAYLSNWLSAARGAWGDHTNHLWTLAVEEQYYLVWPWLVLLVPERRLPWLFGGFILCGPLSCALLLAARCDEITVQVPTTSNLDTLGMGSLLAFLNDPGGRAASYRFRLAGLLVGAPVYVAHKIFGQTNLVLLDLAFAGICVSLVHHAAAGVTGPVRALFDLPPLRYLGKISYGVYLFHNFSEPAVAIVFRRTHLSFPTEQGLRFLVLSGATILAATVSWYCFEKPLNNLKRFFPYIRRGRTDSMPQGS
jgi:peptidoglycan/LPS O-acetylase OafA/YrhL